MHLPSLTKYVELVRRLYGTSSLCFLLGVVSTSSICTAQTVVASLAAAGAPVYLKQSTVPMTYRAAVTALGTRLQAPGNERIATAGKYSDTSGTKNIVITWELPGKTRVDLDATHVVFDGTNTVSSATITDSKNDLLESLADDRPETPLYGLRQAGFAERCLGGWFRTDNGTTRNYSGPFYTIYESVAPIFVRSDKAMRRKLWLYETSSGLLSEVKYNITRAGETLSVETVWGNWTKVNGQAVPGLIVRLENGKTVFTVNVSSGITSPAASDGLFTRP